MSKAAFYTLGCKLNQYDSDAMASLFMHRGYDIVDFSDMADVYIVNTCTVTAVADKKSRQIIRQAARTNPNAIIVVTGCYSQRDSGEIAKIDGVDIIMGTGNRLKVLKAIDEFNHDHRQTIIIKDDPTDWEETPAYDQNERTRAYLKVQEGCNNFCTYCSICRVRGRERSRPLQSALDEAAKLIQKGYKEIVLTGIRLSAYGRDFDDETDLQTLIKAIAALDGDFRIRLGSLEPSTATAEFARNMGSIDKVCNHFHVSMQSGSDAVLKLMNRKYNAAEYLQYINNLRTAMDGAAITTDIMVGFPGEDEVEFENSVATVKAAAFADCHIFQFSPRPGTPAMDFDNQVQGNIKKQRADVMKEIHLTSKQAYLKSQLGIKKRLLIERDNKTYIDGKEGYTDEYIRCVIIGEYQHNTFVDVELYDIHDEYVMARPYMEE